MHSNEAADLMITDWGYQRFLKWENLFMGHPLPGVPAHIAASKMTWIDAERKVQNVQLKRKEANE